MEVTGSIEESVSHHSSVFSVTIMLHGSSCEEAVAVHYEYSESKTELSINNLQKISEENQLGYDLDDFLNIYNAKMDNFFKLDQPKISKRTWQVNPWIDN